MVVAVGFISEKGCVGKPTVCYHIAVLLSRLEEKHAGHQCRLPARGGIFVRFSPWLIEALGTSTLSGKTLFNKKIQETK